MHFPPTLNFRHFSAHEFVRSSLAFYFHRYLSHIGSFDSQQNSPAVFFCDLAKSFPLKSYSRSKLKFVEKNRFSKSFLKISRRSRNGANEKAKRNFVEHMFKNHYAKFQPNRTVGARGKIRQSRVYPQNFLIYRMKKLS